PGGRRARPSRGEPAAVAWLREPGPRGLQGPRALRHPPAECRGPLLAWAGSALLPGCAAGAPGGARGAGGVERPPFQPAAGAGTNAALPPQHHVPWAALPAGRVGHLTGSLG